MSLAGAERCSYEQLHSHRHHADRRRACRRRARKLVNRHRDQRPFDRQGIRRIAPHRRCHSGRDQAGQQQQDDAPCLRVNAPTVPTKSSEGLRDVGDGGDRDPVEKYAEGLVDQPRFSPRKSRGAPMRSRDYADERGASGKSIIATLSANNKRCNASIQAEVAAIAEAVSQPTRLSTLMPVSLEIARIGWSCAFMHFNLFQIILSYIFILRLSLAGLGIAS